MPAIRRWQSFVSWQSHATPTFCLRQACGRRRQHGAGPQLFRIASCHSPRLTIEYISAGLNPRIFPKAPASTAALQPSIFPSVRVNYSQRLQKARFAVLPHYEDQQCRMRRVMPSLNLSARPLPADHYGIGQCSLARYIPHKIRPMKTSR